MWPATVAAAAVVGVALGGLYLSTRPTTPIGDRGQAPTAIAPGLLQRLSTFKDCDVCPEMVELPAGEFMMGSPQDERGRDQAEGPQRRVVIAKRFAIGKLEVTVDQFGVFVAETGFQTGSQCRYVSHGGSSSVWYYSDGSFRQPGLDVTGSHPAMCISWHDAQAYAAWLAKRTGKPYRLPSEAEWEYAARAGTATSYSFGFDESQLCDYGRFADLDSQLPPRGACRSNARVEGPLQVGMLKPNPWGLFDMHGNAWEWAADCWTPDAREVPVDGSPFVRSGNCEVGVVRGGGWSAGYSSLRSAHRRRLLATIRNFNVGFRVAVERGVETEARTPPGSRRAAE